MTLDFYQHLPQTLNPIAFSIGFLAVRWYSIMYLVGFGVVWFLLGWRIKKGEAKKIKNTKDNIHDIILDFLLVAFFGGLVSGRLGYALFYDWQYFSGHPWQIVLPFDLNSGFFEGFYGMSYHGAILGGFLAAFWLAKLKKMDFLKLADFIVPALPAGYFFGRIGNFLNGELFGRVTTSRVGMYFVGSPNLLRYPSQIFEALAEGILLFVILWKMRNCQRFQPGFLLGLYLAGYGTTRFVCEFFREPDVQLGYVFYKLTMGQLFSLGLILISLTWLFLKNKKSAILNLY